MKLKVFASLAMAFACAMLPLKAATTGTLFTIPSGSTGHATIEITAPIALDSYSLTLYGSVGEVVYMNMLRSAPSFDLGWNTSYGVSRSGVTASMSYPDPVGYNKIWVLDVSGLPAGSYYMTYGGSGPAITSWPVSSIDEVISFWEFWFGYDDYTYPPSGNYGFIIWDAAPLMSVAVTDYGY